MSEKTVTKAFNQLIKVNLIAEKRQGLGKPNLIFVGKIRHEEIRKTADRENLQVLNCKIYGSGAVKNTVLDGENFPPINTNNINTDITNLILSNQDEVDSYANIFKQNIEYEVLIDNPYSADLIKNITAVAIDILNTKKEIIYVNSEPKPSRVVKSQLLKINPGHIEYVVNCLKNNTKKVKNIKSYILTVLYNSVNTLHLDSTLAVGHIMNN